jgi:hypothetical protein
MGTCAGKIGTVMWVLPGRDVLGVEFGVMRVFAWPAACMTLGVSRLLHSRPDPALKAWLEAPEPSPDQLQESQRVLVRLRDHHAYVFTGTCRYASPTSSRVAVEFDDGDWRLNLDRSLVRLVDFHRMATYEVPAILEKTQLVVRAIDVGDLPELAIALHVTKLDVNKPLTGLGHSRSLKTHVETGDGVSALHWAVQKGRPKVVEALIRDHGARIDLHFTRWGSVRHHLIRPSMCKRECISSGRMACPGPADRLCAAVVHSEKVTPLVIAVTSPEVSGPEEAGVVLVEAGADMDVLLRGERSILMQAVNRRMRKLASAMIKRGCNIRLMGREGIHAFYVAVRNNEVGLVRLMMQHDRIRDPPIERFRQPDGSYGALHAQELGHELMQITIAQECEGKLSSRTKLCLDLSGGRRPDLSLSLGDAARERRWREEDQERNAARQRELESTTLPRTRAELLEFFGAGGDVEMSRSLAIAGFGSMGAAEKAHIVSSLLAGNRTVLKSLVDAGVLMYADEFDEETWQGVDPEIRHDLVDGAFTHGEGPLFTVTRAPTRQSNAAPAAPDPPRLYPEEHSTVDNATLEAGGGGQVGGSIGTDEVQAPRPYPEASEDPRSYPEPSEDGEFEKLLRLSAGAQLLPGDGMMAALFRELDGPEAHFLYEQAMRGGSAPLRKYKLLFVGEGRAGKTTLQKALSHEPTNREEVSTEVFGVSTGTSRP